MTNRRPVTLDAPTDSLRYQRDLARDVVANGQVRPEVAKPMTEWADRIDDELNSRTT
ncbi:hypothetical protein [Streptomyces sp. NPDC057557]|uniref:hypothetical protein n=1 Tax=Streptomyces sp. NPDC057557 TaxID=3346167 RepID=UPI0036C8BC94